LTSWTEPHLCTWAMDAAHFSAFFIKVYTFPDRQIFLLGPWIESTVPDL
jgi:hypothetical protein